MVLAWSARPSSSPGCRRSATILHAGDAAATIAALAVGHFVLVEYPVWHLGRAPSAGTPFLDAAGATLAFMLVAAAVAAWFLRDPRIRVALGVAATSSWPTRCRSSCRHPGSSSPSPGSRSSCSPPRAWTRWLRLTAPWLGLWLAAAGAILAVAAVAPPDRLVLSDGPIVDPFVGYLAFVALAAALAIGTYLGALRLVGPWPLIVAGGILVYIVSVAIVDRSPARIGGSTAIEELAKQAQVVAERRLDADRRDHVRGGARAADRAGSPGGLALLALRDGQGLPVRPGVARRRLPGAVAGRPGLLLLGSAYAYQRLRPGRVGSSLTPARSRDGGLPTAPV